MPKEEIYDITRDMKCERCKNENNQIKAGSQKYKCKHYEPVFKIFVHAINKMLLPSFSILALNLHSLFLVLFEYMLWALPKFCQYTALDEYSRFRYIEAFEEHSSYSYAVFLNHLIKAFPFPIHCVQTDNGQEFTKRLSKTQNPSPTLFEKVLKKHGISHKLIRPYTPRHNGKVERSHRKDNEYFYASHTFYSFDDFKKQLTVHNRKFPYASS